VVTAIGHRENVQGIPYNISAVSDVEQEWQRAVAAAGFIAVTGQRERTWPRRESPGIARAAGVS